MMPQSSITQTSVGTLTDLIRQISIEYNPSIASTTSFEQGMKNLSDFLGQSFSVDMWIGQSDRRLYRIYIPGIDFSPVTIQGASSTFDFDMTVTGQNQPVDISAPSSSLTLQELMQNILGNFIKK